MPTLLVHCERGVEVEGRSYGYGRHQISAACVDRWFQQGSLRHVLQGNISFEDDPEPDPVAPVSVASEVPSPPAPVAPPRAALSPVHILGAGAVAGLVGEILRVAIGAVI